MQKEFFKVIGVMSGTSIDGLDIAYCEFKYIDNKWNYLIKFAETFKYNEYWINKLQNAPKLNGCELSLLNNEFGNFIGERINIFSTKNKIKADFISSHGHTVFHQPEKKVTLQIGSGACISAITGLNVINDFRVMDVAFGGQGAPLVPIGDKLLFSKYDCCINLGGFANISLDIDSKRIAYDICPVNIVLNHYALKLGFQFDKNGEIASKGNINNDLLIQLNNLEYYWRKNPKSLSKEWVDKFFLPIVEKYKISTNDVLKTLVEHIAIQISRIIDTKTNKNLLFTGGGTYNNFLIERIAEILKIKIKKPNENLIDFKEALIFAFLGVLYLKNEINCLSTVTGAIKNSIGGALYKNYYHFFNLILISLL